MSLQQMNPRSRVWFYGLQEPLTAFQHEELVRLMDAFVGEWKAHGAELQAGYQILNQQCLVIAVDESMQAATGCSIDKSVHLLQEFGAKHEVDFFNRLLIYVAQEGNIQAFTPTALKTEISKGHITGETQVLHALASTLEESGSGLIPLKESWAAKYLG